MLIDDAALAVAHPLIPTAASSTAPAMPRADVNLRTCLTVPLTTFHCGAEEPERGRAEVQERLVEALQREGGTPLLPGPFA